MPDLPLWLWIVTLITALMASTVTTLTSIGAGLITYGILGFVFDLKFLIPLVALEKGVKPEWRFLKPEEFIRLEVRQTNASLVGSSDRTIIV